ncbi:hypothetical protein B0H12DRAFT_1202453 [Mycena haematopus]|nr:hypothetical protein B0H12DRAFT_1202453 [Mycena haematopus]
MPTDSQATATSKELEATDPELGMAMEKNLKPSRPRPSFWEHLNTEVDPAQCTGPLAAFCFMTGFIDAISFTAVFVWCGFQTGNFAQASHDVPPSFNAGAFFGRVGDRIGPHKRVWLVLATFVQVLLTMAAALVVWKSGQSSIAAVRGDPSWTNTKTFVGLAFMSASLGVQGIVGKRLNTQFTTTIVLTTVWVELVNDPRLFNIREKVKTRDHKLVAAVALFFGALIGRALLATRIGAAGALGVGAGVRLLITLAWIVIPGKPVTR